MRPMNTSLPAGMSTRVTFSAVFVTGNARAFIASTADEIRLAVLGVADHWPTSFAQYLTQPVAGSTSIARLTSPPLMALPLAAQAAKPEVRFLSEFRHLN